MTTANQIKRIWEKNPDSVIKSFTIALAGFGYTLTPDYVEGEIRRLYAGGKPKGGPSMFIDGWLKNGLD